MGHYKIVNSLKQTYTYIQTKTTMKLALAIALIAVAAYAAPQAPEAQLKSFLQNLYNEHLANHQAEAETVFGKCKGIMAKQNLNAAQKIAKCRNKVQADLNNAQSQAEQEASSTFEDVMQKIQPHQGQVQAMSQQTLGDLRNNLFQFLTEQGVSQDLQNLVGQGLDTAVNAADLNADQTVQQVAGNAYQQANAEYDLSGKIAQAKQQAAAQGIQV